MKNKCPFCEIIHNQAPATVRYVGNHSMVIVPLNPVTDGHLIAFPYDHVEDAATDPMVSGKTLEDLSTYCKMKKDTGELEDFNIITSSGESATQSVYHLHLHLVPRHKDDGLALPWYSGRY